MFTCWPLLFITCLTFVAHAQTYTVASGDWATPSIWNTGVIPNAASGTITISHAVTVTTSVEADEIVVDGLLSIPEEGRLVVLNSAKANADLIVSVGQLQVYGTLVSKQAAITTTPDHTIFFAGSIYEHQHDITAGEPPMAFWHPASTLLINGFTTSKSLNTAGWQQQFGNVIYACEQQQSFVDFLGNMTSIQGDLHVTSTNGNILRLALDKQTLTTISIGGDFIIEGNSEVWMSRAGNVQIKVGGSFVFASTSAAATYLTTQGTCELLVNGDVSLAAKGALRFASSAGGSGELAVAGNLSMSSGRLAVSSPGSGVVRLNGANEQQMSLCDEVPSTIQLVSDNPAGVTVASLYPIQGDVIVNHGRLTLPSDFNLTGNLYVAPGAHCQVANELSLTGDNDQVLDSNGETFHTLLINKPTGTHVFLRSKVSVASQLLFASGQNTLDSDGNLMLLSQADDGSADATIGVLENGNRIEGTVHVQRYMAGEGRIYRYLSSPVQTASVADWQDDFPITGSFANPSVGAGIRSTASSLFYYDETDTAGSGWKPYPIGINSGNAPLVIGKGYAAFIREGVKPTVVTTSGALNQGTIDLPVTFTPAAHDRRGWNLVGNPFPSAIDWDNASGWTRQNIDGGFYIREHAFNRFLFWDGSVGNLGHGRIAKCQAFWIHTNNVSPVLQIHEQAKSATSTSFNRIEREQPSSVDFISIQLETPGHDDVTYLRLDQTSDVSVSGGLTKLNNDAYNIALQRNDGRFAVSVQAAITCPDTLQLTVYSGNDQSLPSGDYKLRLQTRGLFDGNDYYLTDAKTGQVHHLRAQEPYSFTVGADDETLTQTRFKLVIMATRVPTPTIQYDSVFCTDAAYLLQVQSASPSCRFRWYVNDALMPTSIQVEEQFIAVAGRPDTTLGNDMHWQLHIDADVCQRFVYRGSAQMLSTPAIVNDENLLRVTTPGEWQWYCNQSAIPGAIAQTWLAVAPGLYAVSVRQQSCTVQSAEKYVAGVQTLNIYPNPVDDILYFHRPESRDMDFWEIISAGGVTVLSGSLGDSDGAIATGTLPPGAYLLLIRTGKATYQARFIRSGNRE